VGRNIDTSLLLVLMCLNLGLIESLSRIFVKSLKLFLQLIDLAQGVVPVGHCSVKDSAATTTVGQPMNLSILPNKESMKVHPTLELVSIGICVPHSNLGQ
jgi:hypothetical protein